MLNCPNCKLDTLSTVDSRLAVRAGFVKRRLECSECGERFTSHEIREADIQSQDVIHFNQIVQRLRNHKNTSNLAPVDPDLCIFTILFRKLYSSSCFGRRAA